MDLMKVFLMVASAALCAGAAWGGSSTAGLVLEPSSPLQEQHPAIGTGSELDTGDCWGTVVETMDAVGYTYVYVDCDGEKIWAAGTQSKVAVGDEVVIPRSLPMTDFYSDALQRRFELLYFVPSIQQAADVRSEVAAAHAETSAVAGEPIDLTGIEAAEGGLRIAEVIARRLELAGQEVVVRGKVVKLTANTMGMNWLRLRDSSDPEDGELTVTSQAVVEVGDTVVVKGTVAVDRDFGAGYSYEVIVENAEVKVE